MQWRLSSGGQEPALSYTDLVQVHVYSALAAIGIGLGVGLLVFVPLVAISFRRRGTLTPGRLLLWAAVLIYFVAIWTYTLLPLPPSSDYACVPPSFSLALVVEEIAGAISRGHPLTDFGLLQLIFNVLLFLPLGFFLRLLSRRGLIAALVLGFAVSLFIELTQLTGVWGVYPCAYRMFDVGDLVTNTTGAAFGSLAALAVPARLRGVDRTADAAEPRPVTRTRRLLAMLCDALGAGLTASAAGVAVQVWLQYVVRDRAAVLDGTAAATASSTVPVLVWLAVILATGRSVGDAAVELRYTGGPAPEPVARLLRFVGGIGGYLLLSALPQPFSLFAGLFALAAVVLVFTTAAGRGLPGLLARRRLEDARQRSE